MASWNTVLSKVRHTARWREDSQELGVQEQCVQGPPFPFFYCLGCVSPKILAASEERACFCTSSRVNRRDVRSHEITRVNCGRRRALRSVLENYITVTAFKLKGFFWRWSCTESAMLVLLVHERTHAFTASLQEAHWSAKCVVVGRRRCDLSLEKELLGHPERRWCKRDGEATLPHTHTSNKCETCKVFFHVPHFVDHQ